MIRHDHPARRLDAAGDALRGFLALVALAALLVGLPIALLTWGDWPITGIPTWEQIRELPTTLVSDSTVLAIFTLALWLAWAVFAASVVAEVVVQIRGRRRGTALLGGPVQRLAAHLVASVAVALSSVASLAGSAGPAHAVGTHAVAAATPVSGVSGPGPAAADGDRPVETSVPQRVRDVPTAETLADDGSEAPVAAAVAFVAPADDPAGVGRLDAGDDALVAPDVGEDDKDVVAEWRITVRHGDSPWSLAETYLGDGMRWREIWELNRARPQPDGGMWTNPDDTIRPGWEVVLPGPAPESGGTVTGTSVAAPADAPRVVMAGMRTSAAGGAGTTSAPAATPGPGRAAAVQGARAQEPASPTPVVVEPGDHFWRLAEERLTEAWGRTPTDAEIAPYWRATVEANRARLSPPGDPDLIHPGEQFVLPVTPADPRGTPPSPSPSPPPEPPAEPPPGGEDRAGDAGQQAGDDRAAEAPAEDRADRAEAPGDADERAAEEPAAGAPGAGDQEAAAAGPVAGDEVRERIPVPPAGESGAGDRAERADAAEAPAAGEERAEGGDQQAGAARELPSEDAQQAGDERSGAGAAPAEDERADDQAGTSQEPGAGREGATEERAAEAPAAASPGADEQGAAVAGPVAGDDVRERIPAPPAGAAGRDTGERPAGSGEDVAAPPGPVAGDDVRERIPAPEEGPAVEPRADAGDADEQAAPPGPVAGDDVRERIPAPEEGPAVEPRADAGEQAAPPAPAEAPTTTAPPQRETQPATEAPTTTAPPRAEAPEAEAPPATEAPTTPAPPATTAPPPAEAPGATRETTETTASPEATEPRAEPAPVPVPEVAADEAEDPGFPIGLIGGGVATAGLVLLLDRRRRAQHRRRAAGRRVAMPEPPLDEAERQLRAGADTEAARLVDAALRAAAAGSGVGGPPELRWVEATSEHVTLVLREPAPAPAGFVAEAADRWRTSAPARELVELGSRAASLAPALVPIGTTESGAEVLVDLEASGVVSVAGPPHRVVPFLRAVAVAAATAPWTEQPRVLLVGMSGELTALPWVEVADTLGIALVDAENRAAEAVGALRSLRCASTAQARAAGATPDAWEPLVVVSSDPPGPERYRLAALAARPGHAVAVVCPPGDSPHGRFLTIDDDGWLRFDGADAPVRARQLADDDLRVVADLLEVAARTDDVAIEEAGEPAVRTPAAPAARVEARPGGPGPDAAPAAGAAGTEAAEAASSASGAPEAGAAGIEAAQAAQAASSASGAPGEPEAGAGQRASEAETERETVPAPTALTPTRRLDDLLADVDVLVRVLGDVEAVRRRPDGSEERLVPARQKALEAITYLSLREVPVDREDLEIVLFPSGANATKTFHNTVAAARKTVGEDLFPPPSGGRYELSDRVVTDYGLFCELTAIAEEIEDAEEAAEVLSEALTLVMGEPFTGAGRGYGWVSPHRGMIVAQVVDVAEEVAEIRLATGDWRAAEWAARRGLRAFPCDERMYRLLMRAAHAAGNLPGVQRVFRELCEAVADPDDGVEPEDTIHPETVALLEELTGGTARSSGHLSA